jgi:aminoglycoside phosphotransferase
MAMVQPKERWGDQFKTVSPAAVADNIEGWEQALNQLTEDVMTIQMQLADVARKAPLGSRAELNDAQIWRRRAQFALNAKVAQQRAVKQLVREARRMIFAREQERVRPPEVVHVEDVPGLCMATARTVKLLARQVGCLQLSVPLDEERAALLADLAEDLAELAGILPALGVQP